MALDMTVNSNPLLNINVGEYGQYCLKPVYQLGTIVLYVIRNFICMQRRGLWKEKMSNGARQVTVKVKCTL